MQSLLFICTPIQQNSAIQHLNVCNPNLFSNILFERLRGIFPHLKTKKLFKKPYTRNKIEIAALSIYYN